MKRKYIKELKKQRAIAPIAREEETLMHVNKGDEPHEWMYHIAKVYTCAECGRFLKSSFELSPQRYEFCPNCGQRIDWKGLAR